MADTGQGRGATRTPVAGLGTVFWRDLALRGTLVNLAAGVISLILLARGAHGGYWLALHLLLLPYNLHLVRAVWRAAPARSRYRLAALLWFGGMLVV